MAHCYLLINTLHKCLKSDDLCKTMKKSKLEKFLNREKKHQQKKVSILIYEDNWYEGMGFSEHRYEMKVEALHNWKRNVLINKYKAHSGFYGAGNLEEVQNQIMADRDELIKRIEGHGFEVEYQKENKSDKEKIKL